MNTRIVRKLGISFFLALGFSSVAVAEQSAKGSNAGAKSFVEQAAQGGMTEVKLGKLAQSKSSNPDVQTFGVHLVGDHTKANTELKEVAEIEKIILPSDISEEQKAECQTLGRLNGVDFDKAFAEKMVTAHQKTINLFEKQAKSGETENLRDFANNTLPTLRQHLQMAQDLTRKVQAQ